MHLNCYQKHNIGRTLNSLLFYPILFSVFNNSIILGAAYFPLRAPFFESEVSDESIAAKVSNQSDVIMGTMASQITSLAIVHWIIYSAQKKKTSKLRVIGLCAGNSPHKWQVTRKMFPFDDVIMPHYNDTALCTATLALTVSNETVLSKGPILLIWVNFNTSMNK